MNTLNRIPPKVRAAITLSLLVLTLVLVLAACQSESEAKLTNALDSTQSEYVTGDTDGIFIDGGGDDTPGARLETVVTVLLALETPDHIIDRMDHTTALMGTQSAEVDGLVYTWSYHPRNGIDIAVIPA